MKANELRIGNLILGDESKLARITGFKPFEDSIRCDKKEGCLVLIELLLDGKISEGWSVELSDCMPIKITEDWLKRFGFTKPHDFMNTWELSDAHYTFHEHNEIHQGIYPKGFAACIRCDYVHELQNISFYVNREELKLK